MSDMETIWLVVAGVLGLAVVSFVVYLIVSTARHRPKSGGRHRAPNKSRPHRDTFRTEEAEPEPKKRAAVIVQDNSETLRSELTSQSVVADWDEPLWLVAHDVGTAAAAAREALDAGVEVVCVRGDSAVDRGVASVLAGTETPLAFLPGGGVSGTPVIADARGSEVVGQGVVGQGVVGQGRVGTRETWPEGDPVTDQALAEAMTTALTGQNARVHIGRAVLASPATSTAEAAKTAEAGDAEPAEAAPGWSADAGAGPSRAPTQAASHEIVFLHSLVVGDLVPHTDPALTTRTVAKSLIKGTSFTATVKPDDEEAITRPARSVAFEIGADTPRTDVSAGQALDAYLHASQSLKGWTGVARAMMRKSSRATPLLVPMRSTAFTLTVDKPADLTIDGLVSGTAHPGESTISLERQALVVRR